MAMLSKRSYKPRLCFMTLKKVQRLSRLQQSQTSSACTVRRVMPCQASASLRTAASRLTLTRPASYPLSLRLPRMSQTNPRKSHHGVRFSVKRRFRICTLNRWLKNDFGRLGKDLELLSNLLESASFVKSSQPRDKHPSLNACPSRVAKTWTNSSTYFWVTAINLCPSNGRNSSVK